MSLVAGHHLLAVLAVGHHPPPMKDHRIGATGVLVHRVQEVLVLKRNVRHLLPSVCDPPLSQLLSSCEDALRVLVLVHLLLVHAPVVLVLILLTLILVPPLPVELHMSHLVPLQLSSLSIIPNTAVLEHPRFLTTRTIVHHLLPTESPRLPDPEGPVKVSSNLIEVVFYSIGP